MRMSLKRPALSHMCLIHVQRAVAESQEQVRLAACDKACILQLLRRGMQQPDSGYLGQEQPSEGTVCVQQSEAQLATSVLSMIH